MEFPRPTPLRLIAEKTWAIIQAGGYTADDGMRIEIAQEIAAAVAGTQLFDLGRLESLLNRAGGNGPRAAIEVTGELTQEAARRMILDERCKDVLLLNFASAKRVGGGLLTGAKAQEEDLLRASALYPCLLKVPEYYSRNRECGHLTYTDHMIASPRVPFFRVSAHALLHRPFFATVISAAAPNAMALTLPWPASLEDRDYQAILRRRVGMVLALAEHLGSRQLVLGAWGCGVFRNDPEWVAGSFGHWLEHTRFAGSFDRVVFAIRDRNTANRMVFEKRFAT